MQCTGCGFSTPYNKAPTDQRCVACGDGLQYTADDFLLHGAHGLVKEVRPGQVEMARLVEKVISEKAIALVEGPVGIGKSFAYLVPAILSGKRVVISTAKKQLQHQLARKDLPFLAETIGKPVTVGLMKGKGNYACLVKAIDLPETTKGKKDFIRWIGEQRYADLSELEGKKPHFWGDVTAEDCAGLACDKRGTCGYWKAKQEMKAAQVVIANHHVTAFDLRFGPGKFLGKYNTLIIDEAHQAAAAFRGAFGKSISPFAVDRILRQIDRCGLSTGLENALKQVWKEMFDRVSHLDGEITADPFEDAGERALSGLATIAKVAKEELSNEGGRNVGSDDEEDPGRRSLSSRGIQLDMLIRNLQRQQEALEQIKEPGENTVVYVTTSEKKYKTVHAAPITLGAYVGSKIHALDSAIITSATISIGGSFDDIKYQLGLNIKPPEQQVPTGPVSPAQAAAMMPYEHKKIYEMTLDSPFDYHRQARLYTPKHVPLPVGPNADPTKRENYLHMLTQEIRQLLLASDGNAFVLFTSGQDLQTVYDRLMEDDLNGLTLITQGDDAEGAFKQFMKTPRSAILGLKSFWEGVDVQGEKLRLVIITKLPFPLVSDPVIQARSRVVTKEALGRGLTEQAANGEVFRRIQVPMMLTDLRQGAGRLIRSKTDKGVLAILDCRVWTGSSARTPNAIQGYEGYGAQAVKVIGFSQKTDKYELIETYLKNLRQQKS